MNARRRARAAALGCLAACALPAASVVLTVAPAGATPAEPVVLVAAAEALAAPPAPLAAAAEGETESEEHGTEAEGEHGEEAEGPKGSEKDNGLGIAIIAASLLFGLGAAPFLKLATLKKG